MALIFRKSDKNIGCDWRQVPTRLHQLLGNAQYWIAEKVFPVDEIGARFHHQLVLIHVFPNGKAFAQYRQRGGTKSNVLSDFFIGAHAAVSRLPLLTRDKQRYASYFPGVVLLAPEHSTVLPRGDSNEQEQATAGFQEK